MDLSAKSLAFISTVLKTAKMLKIQTVIIEPGKVRAMDDNQMIAIFQDTNVPAIECGSIGINRMEELSARLDIITGLKNARIEVTVEGEDNQIGFDKYDLKNKQASPPMRAKLLTLHSDTTTIDYRCTNPSILRAPKVRNDNDDKFRLVMDSDGVDIIQKGKVAMKSELVTIVNDKKGAFIHVTDINNDKLKYKLTQEAEQLDDSMSSNIFSYNYGIDVVLTLFKHNPNTEFFITKKGFLSVSVNGLTVLINPRTAK